MSDPIYVVISKISGEVIRGFALDPHEHGFEDFDFDESYYEVVRYEAVRGAIPAPAIKNIGNRLKQRSDQVSDPKEKQFLTAVAGTIDRLVKEYAK